MKMKRKGTVKYLSAYEMFRRFCPLYSKLEGWWLLVSHGWPSGLAWQMVTGERWIGPPLSEGELLTSVLIHEDESKRF